MFLKRLSRREALNPVGRASGKIRAKNFSSKTTTHIETERQKTWKKLMFIDDHFFKCKKLMIDYSCSVHAHGRAY